MPGILLYAGLGALALVAAMAAGSSGSTPPAQPAQPAKKKEEKDTDIGKTGGPVTPSEGSDPGGETSAKSSSDGKSALPIGGDATEPTAKRLARKQKLPADTRLPHYAVLPDGSGVFTTKKGGPARKHKQSNPAYPWKFSPTAYSNPKAFAHDFTGDESRYSELVGASAFKSTGTKTHPSGIKEDTFQSVGVVSPTTDGDGWMILYNGKSDPDMWTPPDQTSPEALAIYLPPSWREEISETNGTKWDDAEFEVDEGLAPEFV